MKQKQNDKIIGRIFFEKYKAIKLIGQGTFCDVYEGISLNDTTSVAIKIKNKNEKDHQLEDECSFLISIKSYGIPKILSFGYSGNYSVLVLELLGKSLLDIFEENNSKMQLKEVCLIGIQVIDRMEYIHFKNIIHRDIKLANFLIGKKDKSIIYLIDFGLAKKFRSSKSGKHIKFTLNKYASGNKTYSSANALRGAEQSRRDDLEAVGYMLVHMLKGHLPWDDPEYESCWEISQLKQRISPNNLCKGLPQEMVSFLKYTKSLYFEQNPDYEYLRTLLKHILMKFYGTILLNFYWDSKKNTQKTEKKELDLTKRNSSPQIRLFSRIKKLLNVNSPLKYSIIYKHTKKNSLKMIEKSLLLDEIKNKIKMKNQYYKKIKNAKNLFNKTPYITRNLSPNNNPIFSRTDEINLLNSKIEKVNNKAKKKIFNPKYFQLLRQINSNILINKKSPKRKANIKFLKSLGRNNISDLRNSRTLTKTVEGNNNYLKLNIHNIKDDLAKQFITINNTDNNKNNIKKGNIISRNENYFIKKIYHKKSLENNIFNTINVDNSKKFKKEKQSYKIKKIDRFDGLSFSPKSDKNLFQIQKLIIPHYEVLNTINKNTIFYNYNYFSQERLNFPKYLNESQKEYIKSSGNFLTLSQRNNSKNNDSNKLIINNLEEIKMKAKHYRIKIQRKEIQNYRNNTVSSLKSYSPQEIKTIKNRIKNSINKLNSAMNSIKTQKSSLTRNKFSRLKNKTTKKLKFCNEDS